MGNLGACGSLRDILFLNAFASWHRLRRLVQTSPSADRAQRGFNCPLVVSDRLPIVGGYLDPETPGWITALCRGLGVVARLNALIEKTHRDFLHCPVVASAWPR